MLKRAARALRFFSSESSSWGASKSIDLAVCQGVNTGFSRKTHRLTNAGDDTGTGAVVAKGLTASARFDVGERVALEEPAQGREKLQ